MEESREMYRKRMEKEYFDRFRARMYIALQPEPVDFRAGLYYFAVCGYVRKHVTEYMR